MNKPEFINAYTIKTGKSKKDSAIDVESFLEVLRESLAEDGKIQFIGEWSMEVVPTKDRKGRNPSNGEEIIIPAGKRLKFKSGKTFDTEVLGK